MPTALFLSPHLDDVAFSCGATVAKLSAEGWRTILCTVFTGSVKKPAGFALACQTDKGLSPEVDYMALRREEDLEAAKILRGGEVVHWPFLEAPHRGYHSAQALFASIRPGDEIWTELLNPLHEILECKKPDAVYLPQGIGGHVDHRQLIHALLAYRWKGIVRWYRDTPYIIRDPVALRDALVPVPGREMAEFFTDDFLEAKIAACTAYVTQIGFQFGGADGVRKQLAALAGSEAAAVDYTGLAERFWETTEM